MKNLSIVIPAYNEGRRIEKTLTSLNKFFPDSEIIVVSNGSKDNTNEILENWKGKNKNFSYLAYPNKLGKGGAILKGLEASNKEFLGFLDADDAFDLNEVKKMIGKLEKADCVIASKWKDKGFSDVNEPFLRKILGRFWNRLVRILLGLSFSDTQAGAKFFKKDVLDIKNEFICKDFSFDVELLYRLKDQKIIECHIPSNYVEGSKFNYKHAIPMLRNLLKLWARR